MDTTEQRWCAWCGPGMMVIAGIGLVFVAGFLPPPDPRDDANEIAQLYIDDQTRIRVGMIMCLVAAALAFPFVVAISKQMRRITGEWSSLAIIQLAAGLMIPLLFTYPCILWGVAAFRPESRDPDTTQTLNDLGWITFVGFGMTIIVQFVVLGVAILRDTSENPVFPRWVGYFNLWGSLLLLPGNVVLAFEHGPLSWNGIFTLWIPLVVFGSWIFLMTWLVLQAIAEQERSVQRDAVLLQEGDQVAT